MSDNGSPDYEAARVVSEKLATLTADYETAGGSNGKSLSQVRSIYASIVPYSSKNWYKQWSKFASDLIELDRLANRPIFRNEGPVPTRTVRSDDDPVFVFDVNSDPTSLTTLQVEKEVLKEVGVTRLRKALDLEELFISSLKKRLIMLKKPEIFRSVGDKCRSSIRGDDSDDEEAVEKKRKMEKS
ncbi:hypothetical protein DFH28DRAFT_1108736 [Melampsora americana]|nr:hypothetical protein DFH28DRAFT_1108736 [Melampsora americana]